MSRIFCFLMCILACISCSKKDNNDSIERCTKGAQTFTGDNGTTLYLATQEWYLQHDGDGGSIHLKFSGSTNADSLFIRTYGDGLISDSKVPLSATKTFENEIPISFTATCVPDGDITSGTQLFVYRNHDTLLVNLTSCALRY